MGLGCHFIYAYVYFKQYIPDSISGHVYTLAYNDVVTVPYKWCTFKFPHYVAVAACYRRGSVLLQ